MKNPKKIKIMERSILFGLAQLRSSLFSAEALLLPLAEFIATGKTGRRSMDISLLIRIRGELLKLLREDADRMAQGVYSSGLFLLGEPLQNPLAHILRLPKVFQEAVLASRRRAQKRTKVFSSSAALEKRSLPEYYRRNFHFQKDGYLSQESADLYDHQVELLFGGAADAMRRLLLRPMVEKFSGSGGRGLRFLELGCGTGSATVFLRACFPKAEIVALDLSEPYLEVAKDRLSGEVDFLRANAEDLPFGPRSFDAVISVFLFHELPMEARKKVLAESRRVLKPNGLVALVDSLQLGDNPLMDSSLKLFPTEFHEPFFTNYLKNPMEGLLRGAGFQKTQVEQGFFSKVITAQRPANPRN